jgi:hypothetical protein
MEPNPHNYTPADYWATHTELIRVLFVLGVDWPLDMRIETFWLRHRLPVVYSDNDPRVLKDAVDLIDLLVTLRTLGLEPRHENNRYV